MEYGHWELLTQEFINWESFVYEIIDENNKRYIGAKTKINGWEKYTGSCKPLNKAIANGLKCRYIILKFFGTAQEGFEYEDNLLQKYNCVKSELYWNRCRRGKEFNTSGIKVSAETKAKLSGENSPKFKGWYVIDEVQYATTKDAANALEVDPGTIRYRTKSENFPEYKFIEALTLMQKPKPKRIAKKMGAKEGECHPKFKGWYVIKGVKYASTKEAADILKCDPATIRYRTKSENFPDYIFLPQIKLI